MLGQVRRVAQENFFTGFSGPLLALAGITIPQLVTGVGAIASAMGAGAQTFMGALSGALGGGVLESLLVGVAKSTEILNRAITPIVQAFTTLGVVGMDYMPRLATAIADAATGFNSLVQASAADGRLAAWIDGGIQSLKDLWSIGGSVVGIFGALNKAAEAGGAVSTLGGMAAALNGIETVMQGKVFQTTMTTLFSGAEAGAQGLLTALGPIGAAFEHGAPAMAEFLRLGGEIAGTFIGGVFTALSNPSFGAGLTTFMEGLQRGVADIVPLLPGLTGSFGLLLAVLGPIVETLGPSLVQVFTMFGTSLATVLTVLEPLMLAVAGSPVLLGLLIGAFAATAGASALLTAAGNVQRIMMAGWIVASGLVRAAMFLLSGQWFTLGLAAVKSGAQTAAVWAMYKLQALQGAAAFVVQSARVAAGWVVMSAAAVKSGVKTAAVWTGTVIASAASGAGKFLVSAGRVVGGWLLMSVQSLFHAGRMAAAWFIALGPVGWVIAAVVGLAAIIIANWDKISKWTKDMWEKHVKPVFDNLSKFITKNVPDAFEQGVKWIGEAWAGLQDLAKKPVKFVVDQVINKGLIDGLNGIGKLMGLKQMDHIKLPAGFSRGGVLPGYEARKRDTVLTPMRPGEGVLVPEVVRGAGRGFIDTLNAAGNRGIGAVRNLLSNGFHPGRAEGGLIHPIPGAAVSSGYGPRVGGVHNGIDFAAAPGTPVRAAGPGRVSMAGWSSGGGGNEVHVDHPNGLQTWYSHLSSFAVKLGDMVKAGTRVGGVGTTGNSTGNHLHYMVLKGGWPNYVNPAGYLEGGGDIPAGGAPWNPLGGLVDGLLGKFKEAFPGAGFIADLAIGAGKKILDGAVAFVTGQSGTDKNAKGSTMGVAPTVYDGGGWLENTGGPQLVQHNKTKPDAVLTYEELQMFKAAAKNNLAGGVSYSPTYQYLGEDPHEVMRRDKARAMDMFNALTPA
jgi:murein DD-endopeptidase MepM/ murein hydrolase activator NlpD